MEVRAKGMMPPENNALYEKGFRLSCSTGKVSAQAVRFFLDLLFQSGITSQPGGMSQIYQKHFLRRVQRLMAEKYRLEVGDCGQIAYRKPGTFWQGLRWLLDWRKEQVKYKL